MFSKKFDTNCVSKRLASAVLQTNVSIRAHMARIVAFENFGPQYPIPELLVQKRMLSFQGLRRLIRDFILPPLSWSNLESRVSVPYSNF